MGLREMCSLLKRTGLTTGATIRGVNLGREEAKTSMSASKMLPPTISELESRLAQAMVPVEPRAGFRRKLRARLVHIQGERWLSPWAAFLLAGGILVGLVSWVSVFMRLLVILLAAMQLLGKWRSRQKVIV